MSKLFCVMIVLSVYLLLSMRVARRETFAELNSMQMTDSFKSDFFSHF